MRARAAREAADAEALAADPCLGEMFDRLHEQISDLAETRWSARGPQVLAAAARALARQQARLDAALLGLVGDVDGRADVVPRAKPTTAGAAFLRTALGMDRHRAARDAGTARLVTGEDPELGWWAPRTRRVRSPGDTWISPRACTAASARPAPS